MLGLLRAGLAGFNKLAIAMAVTTMLACQASAPTHHVKLEFESNTVQIPEANHYGHVLGDLRIATFNAGFDRFKKAGALAKALQGGNDIQAKKVAEIIQRVNPDIVLLNEIDGNDGGKTIELFKTQYLEQSQNGVAAVNYPYTAFGDCNTGVASGEDYDRNGRAIGAADSFGFGHYSGQYCMVVFSKYEIDLPAVKSFQFFRWKDMPNFHQPRLNGQPWYSASAMANFRLSSKTHRDVPIMVGCKRIHVLVSHPTPPVFDGEENRNGKRNFDEIRLWADYIDPDAGGYLYDDQSQQPATLARDTRFVILGDLNAANEPSQSAAMVNGQYAIDQLLQSPYVNAAQSTVPTSAGGLENDPNNPYSASHTAAWRMRADYVLPSSYGFVVEQGGVFWPQREHALGGLVNAVGTAPSSSDHRLVWLDLSLVE